MHLPRRPRGRALLVLVLALIYGAVVLLNRWAIHIGGRRTPLLDLDRNRQARHGQGAYPLIVTLSSSSEGLPIYEGHCEQNSECNSMFHLGPA